MAITVYTYNDKVLKNVANDKWLKKKEAPAGFVMDASNVVGTNSNSATWHSPTYPEMYNGNGKHAQFILHEDLTDVGNILLYYVQSNSPWSAGPLTKIYEAGTLVVTLPAGTYDFTLDNNPAALGGYGDNLTVTINGANSHDMSVDISKFEIRILD